MTTNCLGKGTENYYFWLFRFDAYSLYITRKLCGRQARDKFDNKVEGKKYFMLPLKSLPCTPKPIPKHYTKKYACQEGEWKGEKKMCMLHAVCDIDSFYWRNDVQLLLILFRASTFFLCFGFTFVWELFFSFSPFPSSLINFMTLLVLSSDFPNIIALWNVFLVSNIFAGFAWKLRYHFFPFLWRQKRLRKKFFSEALSCYISSSGSLINMCTDSLMRPSKWQLGKDFIWIYMGKPSFYWIAFLTLHRWHF